MVIANGLNVQLQGSTGTGQFVGDTSPTLITPALGTPSSGNLSNCTNYPLPGNLGYVTGQLTSAQIKTLHSAPITVIAAPATGKVIIILNIWGKLVYGGNNAFTAGAGQTIDVFYDTTTGAIGAGAGGVLFTNALLVGTSSIYTTTPTFSANSTPSNIESRAITFYNSAATEISGNAAGDNVINYSILYIVMDIT